MARSRMRRSSRSRGGSRRRRRADWVYRNDVIGEDNNINSYGGWQTSNTVRPMAVGIENAAATILYDSPNFIRVLNGADIVAGVIGADWVLSQAARITEKHRPSVKAVEGEIFWAPDTWSSGARVLFKGRLGWFEQDPDSGQVLLESFYDIWDGQPDTVAAWANDTLSHIHDWTMAQHSLAGDAGTAVVNQNRRVFWRGSRRQPSESHCLAILWQMPETLAWCNISTRFFTQIRALMAGQD